VKIVMHTMYFPPEVGGLESHVHYLCKGLVERGHEVGVVTSHSVAGTAPREVVDGITVWRTWFPARNPAGWALYAFASIPRLKDIARGADVLHAQDIASVAPCVAARKSSHAAMVATFHTSHFLMRARRPTWRPALAWMVRAPDRSLAASREIAAVAESLAPGVRVEPLPNGVDTNLFRRIEPSVALGARRRLIVPRRLFPKNGVEYFVRALPTITTRQDVEAWVVGDGPERGRLEALASELGVADRIDFMGARPHREMPGLLASCELAVFPSLMEATSVAALEAMSCEVPVAASRVGGLPEIVDEDVGGLFEAGDPGSLADAVVALLQDPALKDRGKRARERVVARWSNDRLVDRHLQIYEEITSR
jgi:glycosyltransferase involved in cell wall biosynthesis